MSSKTVLVLGVLEMVQDYVWSTCFQCRTDICLVVYVYAECWPKVLVGAWRRVFLDGLPVESMSKRCCFMKTTLFRDNHLCYETFRLIFSRSLHIYP